MNDILPEGSAAEARPVPTPKKRPGLLDDNRLWTLWREVTALYPLWRSLVAGLAPVSPFRRETSWLWFDVILGLRSMGSSRAVAARLMTTTDHELDGLIALGEINSRRQEHFFRSLVLAYITVPLTLGAIWAQLSPGTLVGIARNPELAPAWGGLIAGLATAVMIRFTADWRARSFLALLMLVRAERRSAEGRPPGAPSQSRSSGPASGRA